MATRMGEAWARSICPNAGKPVGVPRLLQEALSWLPEDWKETSIPIRTDAGGLGTGSAWGSADGVSAEIGIPVVVRLELQGRSRPLLFAVATDYQSLNKWLIDQGATGASPPQRDDVLTDFLGPNPKIGDDNCFVIYSDRNRTHYGSGTKELAKALVA
jgi:hypothetical protein